MDFHLLDLVSASGLLYLINSLDLPPFSSFSYIGHQEGFPSTGGSGSLFMASLSPALRDPQYPSGPAASPGNASSSCLIGIFLAET